MTCIGIDAIHVSRGNKGASRFERSVIETLARENYDHKFIVFLDCDSEVLRLPSCHNITYVSAPSHNLMSWEQLQLPSLARRYKVKCLLTLADRLPMIYQGAIVPYIFESPHYRHRLAIATGAGLYQRASDILTHLIFPGSLSRAAQLAVASESTCRDLQERYGISASKMEVVHAAADYAFRPAEAQDHLIRLRESIGAPEGYVLHFATEDPRDNTAVALASFAEARLPVSKKLVLAGGANLEGMGFTYLIDELGLNGRIIHIGFQLGQALVDLYQAADAYLDPSLYEGFGFQVLEAMACGVPVICSNTTSLPEVVGRAALTYLPNDVAGFSEGMEAVLNMPDEAAEMRKSGLAQAGLFSWKRTVNELVKLCEDNSN